MSHGNKLVNLASLNTQYSILNTFILCCACQGMGVINNKGVHVDDDIAFFTQKQIESWISKAPESFTLNMDLIQKIGPGGQFLTSRDTMEKCRSHSWNPLVGVRG
jgi:trimethylamine:corrinoid methyltransferase-like protein